MLRALLHALHLLTREQSQASPVLLIEWHASVIRLSCPKNVRNKILSKFLFQNAQNMKAGPVEKWPFWQLCRAKLDTNQQLSIRPFQ